MPATRRRGVRARTLDPLSLLQFNLGPCPHERWRFGGDPRSLRATYEQNRERLLSAGNFGPLHTFYFWQFEGPDDCRDDSEPDLWFVEGGLEAAERLTRRRLAYLVEHAEVFDDLPSGDVLHRRIRDRYHALAVLT